MDGQTDTGQSYPYVPLYFAGDTKMITVFIYRRTGYIKEKLAKLMTMVYISENKYIWMDTASLMIFQSCLIQIN